MPQRISKTAPLIAVAAFTLSAACDKAKYEPLPVDPNAQSLATALESQPTTPVQAGTFDLICAVYPEGEYDVELIPMWGSAGDADVLAHIDIGERHVLARGNAFRIPAVEVVPKHTKLVFHLADEDKRFDDPIGEFTLEVGSRWPARFDPGTVYGSCDWLTPEREKALEKAAAQLEAPVAKPSEAVDDETAVSTPE